MTIHASPAEVNIMTGARAAEEGLAEHLSGAVRRYRKEKGLSLDALAELADLSKGTVVALEQGTANPSIAILCRLAAALGVSVTDLLIARPFNEQPQAIERTTPAPLWKTKNGSIALLEASTSGSEMFELWSWTIAKGEIHHAEAHSPGTCELLSVQKGRLTITVGDESIVLGSGQSARLITDKPHSYAASKSHSVSFSMAVLEKGVKKGTRR
jgi:transcriptional regulator with XRE-family HTH domain